MHKVLVVEDFDDVRESVVCLLKMENYEVHQAAIGKEALSLLNQNEYDLLILDWELPDIQGVEICAQYRQNGGLAPVLMLTGRSSASDKEEGLNIGADDYLTKPFDSRELLARVKSMLRRASMPKQIRSDASILKEMGATGNLVGKVLCGKYELTELLGEGGMGCVYKAKHRSMGNFVAAKIIKKDQLLDERNRKRFEQEAKMMAICKHRNLVMVYDHGHNDDGCPYIVMEYLEGQNLSGLIADRKRLPFEELLPILTQICDALQHAHQNGLVHRDLKPGNVMLIEDEEGLTVKVLDLGLAKMLNNNPERDRNAQSLTQTGEIFGSPLYMSPEQGMGNSLDHRSDIYSLGCLMYEALTGVAPFKGDNFIQTVFAHLNEPAAPFNTVAPDANIKPSVEKVVLACLEKDPSKRPQKMSVLKDMLVDAIMAPDATPAPAPAKAAETGDQKQLSSSGKHSVSNFFRRLSGVFQKPSRPEEQSPVTSGSSK